MSDRIEKTLLLVEDEAITALLETKQLENEGYRVIVARDGETAIDIVSGYKNPVDLVLMDIDLGTGLDGTEAAEIILGVKDVPVVFLSSHTEPAIVEKTERITSYGYVVKNSSPTVLYASIKMAFKLFEAKRSIQQNEEKYRNLVELSPYLIAIYRNREILYINGAGARMLGSAAPEPVVGKSVDDFFLPGEAEPQNGSVKGSDRRRIRTAGGDVIDIEVVEIPLLFENEPAIQMIAHDITEHTMLEKRRRIEDATINVLLELHQKANSPAKELFDFMLEASLQLTRSVFSFVGFMSEDESDMSIHAWSKGAMESCSVQGPPMHFPIAEAGVWGECVRRRKPVIINTYQDDVPGKRGCPAGHVPITRFMIVPVFDGDRIVAVGAVANKEAPYDSFDAQTLLVIFERMWGNVRRRRSEENLRRSEDRYRSLVAGINDVLFTVGDNGVVEFISPVVERVTGYGVERFLGKQCLDFVHPDDLQGLLESFGRTLQGELKPFEFRLIDSAGNPVWVRTSSKPVSMDGRSTAAVTGVLTDISGIRMAEQKVLDNLRFRKNLIDAIPVPLYYKDTKGVYLGFNRAFAELFGTSESELVGKTTYDISPSDLAEIYSRKDEELFGNPGRQIYESRLRDVRGVMHEVLFFKATFNDDEGNLAGLIGIILDKADGVRLFQG